MLILYLSAPQDISYLFIFHRKTLRAGCPLTGDETASCRRKTSRVTVRQTRYYHYTYNSGVTEEIPAVMTIMCNRDAAYFLVENKSSASFQSLLNKRCRSGFIFCGDKSSVSQRETGLNFANNVNNPLSLISQKGTDVVFHYRHLEREGPRPG